MEHAGVALRFVAVLIDTVVSVILLLVFAVLLTGDASAEGWWPILLFVAYYAVSEAFAGKTVGKHAVGLRVVDESGADIGVGQALVHNLFRIVDAFLFYLVGAIAVWSTPKRQRVGDLVAGTFVVHDRGEYRERARETAPVYERPAHLPRADDSTVYYTQERFLDDLARAKRADD
jgi:uncharacterized RDD family membrane protein YckC